MQEEKTLPIYIQAEKVEGVSEIFEECSLLMLCLMANMRSHDGVVLSLLFGGISSFTALGAYSNATRTAIPITPAHRFQ